jgi:hypothetical protein
MGNIALNYNTFEFEVGETKLTNSKRMLCELVDIKMLGDAVGIPQILRLNATQYGFSVDPLQKTPPKSPVLIIAKAPIQNDGSEEILQA